MGRDKGSQKTAKTVADVLLWIESTPHHRAAWRTKDGRDYARYDDPEAFLVLDGARGARLRIPLAIQEQTRGLTEPGGAFDTRMYRANEKGRALLARLAEQAVGSAGERLAAGSGTTDAGKSPGRDE